MVSQNERKHIEAVLGHPVPRNYHVEYLGVPDANVTPAKRHLADGEAIIFGATSRMVTAKGIGELIAAAPRTDPGCSGGIVDPAGLQ